VHDQKSVQVTFWKSETRPAEWTGDTGFREAIPQVGDEIRVYGPQSAAKGDVYAILLPNGLEIVSH